MGSVQPESLPRVLGRAWACWFEAVALLSVPGMAVVATRIPIDWATALQFVAMTLALGGLVALVPAGVVGLLWMLVRARFGLDPAGLPAKLAVSVVVGLAIAGGGALALSPWAVYDPYHLHLIFAGGALAACMAMAIALHCGWRRLGALGIAIVGVAAFIGDAVVQPHHFARLHDLAAFVSLAALASVAWFWPASPVWRRRAALGLLGLAVVAQPVAWLAPREVSTVGLFHGVIQPKLLTTLRAVSDLDRDGHSALVGGGDCNDFDAEVHPTRCEHDDGRDENCNGLDERGSRPLERAVAVPSQPWSGQRPDVYIIVVDTLRSDYGGQPRPPHLDALARESMDFEQAYTPYPSTFRGLTAFMQGRYWRFTGSAHPNLAETLREVGYKEQLWHGTRRYDLGPDDPALFSDEERTREYLRMDKKGKGAHSRALVDDLVAEIAATRGEPRLRWVHLDDPHYPWTRGGAGEPSIDRYRAEVSHVDEQVGRVLAALEDDERGREAVIVLFGDHGEEFGEHGGTLHGGTLYEEVTRVPLMLRLPGIEPRIVGETASLIDVYPTLVHYLRLQDPGTLQGYDWLGDEPPPDVRVLSEIERTAGTLSVAHRATLQMVRGGEEKLIADLDRNALLLFDLGEDPEELKSVAHTRRDRVDDLRRHLARWQDAPGCRPPAAVD